jgi:CRISPR-associated protein (TIGR02710 family)
VLTGHRGYLEGLLAEPGASRARAVDLLANARRRQAEARYDDAVARLYRATEVIAQARLREALNIGETGAVPLDRLPESLRAEFASRRRDDGTVFLGLQDDYRVLQALGAPLGQRFYDLGLADRQRSPLTARNQSILAHGFEAASERTFAVLWEACAALVELDEKELPVFPRLGPGRK